MSHSNYFHSQPAFAARLPNQPQFLQDVQVLLVEDEIDVAELLVIILQDAGAEVVLVTTAAEALAFLKNHSPDVLLCNIKLPDHNGNWLIQQIRQQEVQTGQFLPALAVTSYPRDFDSHDFVSDGFQGYLHKFSHLEQLVVEVFNLALTAKHRTG